MGGDLFITTHFFNLKIMASIKLSNIHEHKVEVLKRLRGKNIINKAKVIKAIKAGDWKYVYQEMLYRIESYTMEKIVNYTRNDIKTLVTASLNHGPEVIAEQLYNKTFSVVEEVTEEFDTKLTVGSRVLVLKSVALCGSILNKFDEPVGQIVPEGSKLTVTEIDTDEGVIHLVDESGDDVSVYAYGTSKTTISRFLTRIEIIEDDEDELIDEDPLTLIIEGKFYRLDKQMEGVDADDNVVILSEGSVVSISTVDLINESIIVLDSNDVDIFFDTEGKTDTDITDFASNITKAPNHVAQNIEDLMSTIIEQKHYLVTKTIYGEDSVGEPVTIEVNSMIKIEKTDNTKKLVIFIDQYEQDVFVDNDNTETNIKKFINSIDLFDDEIDDDDDDDAPYFVTLNRD